MKYTFPGSIETKIKQLNQFEYKQQMHRCCKFSLAKKIKKPLSFPSRIILNINI